MSRPEDIQIDEQGEVTLNFADTTKVIGSIKDGNFVYVHDSEGESPVMISVEPDALRVLAHMIETHK